MQKMIIIAGAAVLLGIGGIGLAIAGSAGEKANMIRAMKQKIDALGYDVRRLRIDDGVFKTLIVDRESGGAVKATFDRANGEFVRAKLASTR
jgi:hypothetical protein